jgi:hypothetical protein
MSQDKTTLLGAVMLWICISAVFSLIPACGKATHSFYHQVILEDEIVGIK